MALTPNFTSLKAFERNCPFWKSTNSSPKAELSFCSAQAYHSLKERVIKAAQVKFKGVWEAQNYFCKQKRKVNRKNEPALWRVVSEQTRDDG
jgi:hypothetical protein